MTFIGPQSRDGTIPSIAIDKGPWIVTTAWYRGRANQHPVVQVPEELNSNSDFDRLDWNLWMGTEIEHTRVWPWATTQYELSQALADLMRTMRLSLESQDGIDELAFDFYDIFTRLVWQEPNTPQKSDVIKELIRWTADLGVQPEGTLKIGPNIYHFWELEVIRTKFLELSRVGEEFIHDPWPRSG